MLCNSLVDLSSIHIVDKSNDGATRDESSIKSDGSLPSLREPLKVFSPNTVGKLNGQAMTMKQIDTELNALRRENFDLKLRLYVENQKKSSKKTHSDDDERKPQNTIEENFKKILIDKDNQIRNLKSQINDLDNKMKFEIGILRREKEAYANDLETSENLCRQFMEHLTEVCDFWKKFLLEANSSGDHSLLESISNLLNSSQDILNSSSMIINEKLRDGSSKIINESSSDKLRNKLKEFKRSSDIKGMSSLGLLSDLSHFITKDNSPVPVKTDCETQTDMVASEIKALIQTAVLLATRGGSDAATQTQLVRLTEKECQTCISSHVSHQKTQTDSKLLSKTGKDLSLQSKISNGLSSRSTQTNSTFEKAGSVSEVAFDESGIKKSKKCKSSELGKTSSGNQLNNKLDLNCILNKQDKVAKSVDLEDNRDVQKSPDSSFIAAMKSFTIFKSNLSPITESPRLKEYSPSAIQERQEKGTVNDLTYSLESLKLNNSSGASPCLGKITPNQVATSERKTVSINERLNTIQKAGRKVTLTPLAEKNGNETTIKKASSLKKNQYLHSKGENAPKQAAKHEMLTSQNKLLSIPDNDNDFTTDDEPNDEKESDSVRVYLTFKYYQLLRGHLGRLSVRLNELDSLNKDHFILEIIDSQEYSTAIEPCLTNMRKTINSCRIICHHFTIVDENSVLAQYERIKAKKENIEKAISQQMKKADKLLKKAKINLRV